MSFIDDISFLSNEMLDEVFSTEAKNPNRSNIIQVIEEIGSQIKVYTSKPVTKAEIRKAEKELGLSFSTEYKEYVERYGMISFGSHEFTGLGKKNHLNVVSATINERNVGDGFPEDCILLENNGIDGLLTLLDSSGTVYHYYSFKRKKVKIASSLSSFFKNMFDKER